MDNNLLGVLSGLIGNNMGTIQSSLGEKGDKSQIMSAASMAIPLMLGALNKNASSEKGASSLASALTDHDGSGLGNIGSLISGFQGGDGAGILKHMFGSKEENVANSVSKASGLNIGATMGLLTMLAPIVLQFLGKQKKEQNLDAGGVANLTSSITNMLGGSGNDGIMGMVSGLLDSNGDGNITDDLLGMVGGLFGKK